MLVFFFGLQCACDPMYKLSARVAQFELCNSPGAKLSPPEMSSGEMSPAKISPPHEDKPVPHYC